MTETIERLETEVGLAFSKPKIVMTKFGERQLCTAPITEKIKDKWWEVWNSRKPLLKAAGFGCGKNNFDGEGRWEVTHWVSTMSAVDREQAAAASRATDAAIEIPIPEGLALMPFQKAGVAYAMPRAGTLIGDEMGLGKTIQAIAVANAMVPAPKKILVVAPASLLANWRNEINKWQTLADMPVHIIRPGLVFTGKPDGWYVINYDIVTRYAAVLTSTDWDLAVYDECHNMKTRTAQRTLTLLGGTKLDKETKKRVTVAGVTARKRLMLTGTPILNRPAELYPLLHNLDPKRWGSWSSFTRRYCAAQYNGFGYDTSGDSRLDELNARLRETVMVRRLKNEVLTELPAKRRQVVPLTYDEDDATITAAIKREKDVYEKTENAIAQANAAKQRAEAEGDEEAYKIAVKALNEVSGIAFSEMAKARHETAIAKVPYVIEHLKETTGKILCFAWHQDVVDAICDAVRDQGVVSITGKTPQEKRDGIKDAFQTNPNIRFFVGNIRAAGEGLTLTASSHVVFAELDWTPARISQAEDRAHRIGQTECVLVQHLVLDDSLDARMAKMVVQKQEVIDRALNQKTEGTEKERPEIEVSVVPLAPEQMAEQQAKDDRRARLDEVAATLTPERIAAIHAALRTVAAYDEDHARYENGVGFSKLDTIFGGELAAQASLRPRQAAAAMKMIRKYRRQYDSHLYQTIFGVEA
jgi:SWI/SNF-related matrix-associated actin-dependent regulator 1 of chromatin subfamily A